MISNYRRLGREEGKKLNHRPDKTIKKSLPGVRTNLKNGLKNYSKKGA